MQLRLLTKIQKLISFQSALPFFFLSDDFFQPSIFLLFFNFKISTCLCVLEVLHPLTPSSPAAFFLLRHPSHPPSLAAGRFSNIHYFHQGHCNPTGSAKDLAGADKGPPRTRHCNNLTNPSLTQNPLRQRGIPLFSIKPLKSTWCHMRGGSHRLGLRRSPCRAHFKAFPLIQKKEREKEKEKVRQEGGTVNRRQR